MLLALPGSTRPDDARPNVLIVAAHCLGYSDLGCYGGEIDTPHLDQLAKDGIRYLNAHNQCSRIPSMVHLLTGQDPHRLRAIEGVKKGHLKSLSNLLSETPHVMLADAMREAGYRTLLSGQPPGISPKLLGFEERIAVNPWSTFLGWKDGEPPKDRKPTVDDVVYLAEDASRKLARAIEKNQADKPFFAMWISRSSMYGMNAKRSDIERFHPRYQKLTPTAMASARYQRLLELGLVQPDWPWTQPVTDAVNLHITSRDRVMDDENLVQQPDLDIKFKTVRLRPPKDYAEMMAIYAAQTHMLDRSVGHLMRALERSNAKDNTLVIFLVLQGVDYHSGSKALGWTLATGVPFQGRRRTTYSGGITTPFIISWPERISESIRGGTNRTITHLGDVLPTILNAARIDSPQNILRKNAQDQVVAGSDGRSLHVTFDGKLLPTTLENPICIEILNRKTVITDDWKWIKVEKSKGKLYRMKTDRLENRDVADAYPEQEEKMRARFNKWGDTVGAHPEQYGDEKTRRRATGSR